MSDTPLAGRVAVVSGGGRGLGRSFCRALARQGAKVVVNNRNRVTDADGRGPADHVAAEIVAAAARRGRRTPTWPTRPAGRPMFAAAVEFWGGARDLRGSAADPAAMAVMRPAGYGRIILVGSTGGLHGDVGLSAYAASKGGLLAFGRSLAAEGAGKDVLTNMLLPYALTQLTGDGMPARPGREWTRTWWRRSTALVSPECRLNGEYLVTVDAFNDLMSGGAS